MKVIAGIGIGALVLVSAGIASLFIFGRDKTVEQTVELNSVSALTVNATSADIKVKKGKTNQIHYKLTEKLVPEISEDNGRLTVTSKPENFLFFNWNWFSSGTTNTIEITLTENTLEQLSIDVSSADITICDISVSGSIESSSGDVALSDMKECGDLSIESTSGDLDIRECTFGKLTLDHTSGDIVLRKVQADSISGESTSGDVSASDLETGEFKFSCTSGDVELELAGQESDYGLDLSCTVGDITVAGHNNGSRCRIDNNSDKKIIIDTTSGDIDIEFR